MKKELEALLKEVEAAYDSSNIKKRVPGLNYSLIAGSLQKRQPLIIGFNWGGGCTPAQTTIEEEEFCLQDLGSMKRIVPFCQNHFPKGFLNDANQTNYCFFRSKEEGDVWPSDVELCQPIFSKLLALLEPSIILCFSSQLRKYLCNQNRIKLLQPSEIAFERAGKLATCFAAKGYLSETKIAFLPHPNSRIPGKTRNEAWKFAVGNT